LRIKTETFCLASRVQLSSTTALPHPNPGAARLDVSMPV
jgi:hypothetical protein